MKKPQLIFLVGMPSVGKSSYIKQMGWNTDPNVYIHSTDDIVSAIAHKEGITYDDFMEMAKDRFYPDVIIPLLANFEEAKSLGKDIVVDMVNENKVARARTLDGVNKEDYEITAVVFGHEPWQAEKKSYLKAVKNAVKQRSQGTGKTVPNFVLDRMFGSYETPDQSEGFDEIVFVDPQNPLLQGY